MYVCMSIHIWKIAIPSTTYLVKLISTGTAVTICYVCKYWVRHLTLFFQLVLFREIVAFGAQKTHTHTLQSRRTQNESLFGADFGPEA